MSSTGSPRFRQMVAGSVPAQVRKLARMAEHYVKRLRTWTQLVREFQPADARSRAVLRNSLLRAPITALGQLDSFQPPRLLDHVDVSIPGVGRFTLRAGTDDVLHVLSAREPRIRQAVETSLAPGGTFIDAGANIGFYSILAGRQVGTSGRVIAFEMMPDTAKILRRHVELNNMPQIEVVERALSDKAGERIAASVEPGKHGQASIVAESQNGERTILEVETATLDSALAGIERVDLIKMDLEGAEFLALSGGLDVLSRTACLVFESNGEDSRIFELLRGQGFVVERVEGHDFVAHRDMPGGSPSKEGRQWV